MIVAALEQYQNDTRGEHDISYSWWSDTETLHTLALVSALAVSERSQRGPCTSRTNHAMLHADRHRTIDAERDCACLPSTGWLPSMTQGNRSDRPALSGFWWNGHTASGKPKPEDCPFARCGVVEVCTTSLFTWLLKGLCIARKALSDQSHDMRPSSYWSGVWSHNSIHEIGVVLAMHRLPNNILAISSEARPYSLHRLSMCSASKRRGWLSPCIL